MTSQLLSTLTSDIKRDANNHYTGKPITEIITNGFFTVDRKWTVKYWNKAAERLLRIKSKDIIGKNLWETFVGVLPVNFYAVYHKAFIQDIPVHFEEYWGEMGAWFDVITYHCDDDLSVSFKSSNHPGHRDYATFPGHQAKQLKILNELYRFVTSVTNDCLWEWDLQAKELFWIDGGHKRAFGYQVENALIPQIFWESRLHPEDKERILARLHKILTEGSERLWEDEYRFQKANGHYAHVHDRGHIIYDNDGKASRMIGATQDITEKILLKLKLEEERHTRQREITHAVLTAQEKERADIGKELHDNINQMLVVAKLYIQVAQNSEKNREINLRNSADLIANTIKEIRKISKILIIPDKHIIGLFDNIKNLLGDLMRVDPIKINFHADGISDEYLDESLQVTIFRIVQEQINNILKHSEATNATIKLSKQESEIILFISDNGKGCNLSEKKPGVGIINIKSRAELYSGNVTIVSKPGEGYELKVVLSLKGRDQYKEAFQG